MEGEVYYDPREALPASDRLTYHEMMPLEALETEYRRGGVALELAAPNPERELASTIRTIGFLWCGLPVVINDYSYLADDVESYGAGWVVPPDDRERLRATFKTVLEERGSWVERGRAAQRLARDKFTWPVATEALARFCAEPFERPKSASFLTETRRESKKLARLAERQESQIKQQVELIEHLKKENKELRAEIDDAVRRLQSRFRSRVLHKFRRLLGGR